MNSRMITVVLLCLAPLAIVGCKGTESMKAPGLSAADKQMDCEEIAFAIQDAEYFKRKAQKNRGLRWGNVLWPFAYPATYMSSSEAIESAEDRIGYLKDVAEIKRCNAPLYEGM